jgi:hypothetical protein
LNKLFVFSRQKGKYLYEQLASQAFNSETCRSASLESLIPVEISCFVLGTFNMIPGISRDPFGSIEIPIGTLGVLLPFTRLFRGWALLRALGDVYLLPLRRQVVPEVAHAAVNIGTSCFWVPVQA